MPNIGLVLLALLLFDISVTGIRSALLNSRPMRLLTWRERNLDAVNHVLALLDSPLLRPTLRLARAMTRLSIAGLLVLLMQTLLPLSRWFIAAEMLTIIFATLLLIFLELAVEALTLRAAERWALRLVGYARLLVFLFTPLAYPLSRISPRTLEDTNPVTEDELKTWVESDSGPGTLEREEREMIYSIFQFGQRLVREIMVPRMDMLALEAETSLNDARKVLIESGHSRVPVYDDSVDNILGLLYAKDLLKVMGEPDTGAKLRDLIRPAYFIPETKKANDLLTEMQDRRIHMAIAVDEYGGVSGVVTLEDILEEIIGEIRDEYDASEDVPYQDLGDGEFIFQGGVDIDAFNEVMSSHLPRVESDTLAGYVYDQLGRVPQGGESLNVDGLSLTVEQVAGRRIRRVRAKKVANASGDKHDNTAE